MTDLTLSSSSHSGSDPAGVPGVPVPGGGKKLSFFITMDRPGHADSILFNYLLHSYLPDHYLGDCPVEVDQYCFLLW